MSLGQQFSDGRKRKKLKLKELAAMTGIDQTLLSRFEKDSRIPTEAQVQEIIRVLGIDPRAMEIDWMAERLLKVVQYHPYAMEALKVAETRVAYLSSDRVFERPKVSSVLAKKLDELEDLRSQWQNKPKMGATQLKRMQEYFDVEYTFESNRIEGNTLTLQETALVVNEGLTIGGKSMREHLEVINHSEAIDFIRGLVNRREDLSRRVLLEVHHLILKGVDADNAGRYRRVPVRISGSDYELPQPFLLDRLMEDYFGYYFKESANLHPVLLAAEMHERLVSIHPFIDGNGRTARLVMNLVLLRNGYTRANIKGNTESRLAYYQALQEVQKNNNPEPFYALVIDECLRSIKAHLELV